MISFGRVASLDLLGGTSEGCVDTHHIFIIGSLSLSVASCILLLDLKNFHVCYVPGDGGWLQGRECLGGREPEEDRQGFGVLC